MRWWFDVLSLFEQYLSHGNSILAMEKWDDDGLSFYDPFNNISVLEKWNDDGLSFYDPFNDI